MRSSEMADSVDPEEYVVLAVTRVYRSSLAELRFQVLPVSQRVWELLQADPQRGEPVRVHRGGGGEGGDGV